jgi:hypothetical protein
MTGGRVVVLGPTGRNFAAGMSGGIAYVLDDGSFAGRCNLQLVALEALDEDDRTVSLLEEHAERTATGRGARRLEPAQLRQGDPHDYRRARRPGDAVRYQDYPVSAGGVGFVRQDSERPLMGQLGGFLKIERAEQLERDPRERIHDVREFLRPLPLAELRNQGARCMECGVPFCHHGCPLGNLIPDWNDLVYRDQWHEAIGQLHRTNNFPEFTGRLCPAPCEAACVLEIDEGNAVSIKQI